LQLAAVCGRDLDLNILRELAPEKDLDGWLTTGSDVAVLGVQGELWRFSHDKLREGVMDTLTETERPSLHRRVAQAVEKIYPEASEQAATLAHLWGEAGDDGKELHYCKLAGELAVRNSANVEAIDYYRRALELIRTLPGKPDCLQEELELQVGLAVPMLSVTGWTSLELESIVSRMRELSRKVGETPHLFPVNFFALSYYGSRAKYQITCDLAEQLLTLAEGVEDSGLIMIAHWAQGWFPAYTGKIVLALKHYEQAIDLYNPEQHQYLAFLYGQDLGINSLSWSSWLLGWLGYPEQARKRCHEAVTLAQKLSHPLTLAFTQLFISGLYDLFRDVRTSQDHAEACIRISQEHGLPVLLAWGKSLYGIALVEQGHTEEGISELRQGIADSRTTGYESGNSAWLTHLAEAYWKAGWPEKGLTVIAEALDIFEKSGEHFWEAEIHRVKGELLLIQGDEAEAEASFKKAIEVTWRQFTRSWELRATMSLCRLWQIQGKSAEARQLLEKIYGWFTEGFDTGDLREAKALLDELQ